VPAIHAYFRPVILKTLRVREKCLLYDYPRAFSPCIMGRTNDKKFGRVIRRLSWRIISCTSIYARYGIKSLPKRKRDRRGAALPINAEQKSKRMCLGKKTSVVKHRVDAGRRENDGKNEWRYTTRERCSNPVKVGRVLLWLPIQNQFAAGSATASFRARVFPRIKHRRDLFDEKLHT